MARTARINATVVQLMRFREITEAVPVKPLTPAQARRRTERQQKAQAKLADTQATTAIRINAEKRKLGEI